MKIYTTLILALIFEINMEVDAGSFNLSGSFNPGISFSRSRRLNNRERDNESGDVNNLDWPQSLDTSRFKTNILLPDPNANEAITDHFQPHNYRSRHRTHKRSI
nr:uncharacterized protein LOC116771351 isoform X2 [Danaus plexippus plexippus]